LIKEYDRWKGAGASRRERFAEHGKFCLKKADEKTGITIEIRKNNKKGNHETERMVISEGTNRNGG